MRIRNTGSKDVFLGGGSRLPPGDTVTVKKKDGEYLLRNPNLSEVKNAKSDKSRTKSDS